MVCSIAPLGHRAICGSTWLEFELHSQLNLAGVEGRGESKRIRGLRAAVSFNAVASERRRTNDIVDAGEIDSVEQIERFDDSFQPVIRISAKTEFLRHTQIKVDVIRPAAGVPACERRTVRIGLRIIVRVESEEQVERMSASVGKDWRDRDARNRIDYAADDQSMALIKRRQ